MFDCYLHAVFERHFFVANVPLVLALADPYRAVFVYPLLGGNGLPPARIERISAVAVDCHNDGIVQLHPDGFRVDPGQICIVLQLFGGAVVAPLVDQFGSGSLEVHDHLRWGCRTLS